MRTARIYQVIAAALLASAPLRAQATSAISGTVVDALKDTPVSGAILRLDSADVSAVTDADGTFVLRGVLPGLHSLTIQHAEYGTRERAISVARAGESFSVLIHLAAAGMTVDIVDAVPAGEPARAEPAPELPSRATPLPFAPTFSSVPQEGTVVAHDRIMEAAKSSRTLGEVIRQTVPTLRPRQLDDVGTTLCLEFRGAAARSMRANTVEGQCFHPKVFLDGVPLQDPAIALNMTALQGVEWIQALSPAEAGAQYGSAPYGVIVVATTTGASRMAALGIPSVSFVLPSRRRTFDWNEDPEGHPLLRTAAGALVGNLVGLAAGVAVGRECIYIEERTKEIEQSCSRAGVASAGLTAFVLPAFGSAMGAHWGGRTNTSQGSLVPAVLSASMMIFPGYIFSLMTVGDGVQTMNQVGRGMLLVGTPALVTLADRMFRKLRN